MKFAIGKVRRRSRKSSAWHCCLSLLVASQSWGQDMPSEGGWKPAPPKRVPMANLKNDDRIDALDLGRLAINWQDVQEVFGDSGSVLLGRMATNWKKVVPHLFQKPFEENRSGNELRSLVTGDSPFASKRKQVSSPLTVGIGVRVSGDTPIPTQAIYADIENQELVSTQPNVVDPSFEGTQRWDSVSAEFSSRFASSFAEEADFRGLDLTLEASSAVFSGSLSSEWASSRIRRSDTFKYMTKTKVDFGWAYQPNPVVREQVLEDLLSPDPSVSEDKYGTHYVYAQRLVAELYVDIIIQSTLNESVDSLELDINANYSGFSWSAELGTQLRQFQEDRAGTASVSVEVRTVGGPSSVEFNGQTFNFPTPPLSPTDPRLDDMEGFAEAWRSGVTVQNAISDGRQDYFIRPLADFIPGGVNFDLPFTRTAQLRAWFIDYVKNFERISHFQDELLQSEKGSDADLDYRGAFQWFNTVPIPSTVPPGTRERDITNRRYHNRLLEDDLTIRNALLEAGRELFQTEIEDPSQIINLIYNPTDQAFKPREIQYPKIDIIVRGVDPESGTNINPDNEWHNSNNDTDSWTPEAVIFGDFSDTTKYDIVFEHPNNNVPVRITEGPIYRPDSDTTYMRWLADYDNGGQAPGGRRDGSTISAQYAGFAIYIIDKQVARQRTVIAVGCYNPACRDDSADRFMPWDISEIN